MNDIVISGGLLVDGTGAPPRRADLGITGGRISQIGEVSAGRRVIRADGLIVTLGFVDVHSHYDGQWSWDPLLTPSVEHGVTTTVMGNCGVGFAPVAADRREWLIELMEGVEDIPGAALTEGIVWAWETFPEFLDSLDAKRFAMDIGTQVPHGAVRGYVMGDRGAANEAATRDDIDAMAAIVAEGIRAGALGFTSSRTMLHRALDSRPVPGTFAGQDELLAIAAAVASAGGGVFEVASDVGLGAMDGRFRDDLEWFGRVADETGLVLTYTLLQKDTAPEQWRDVLALTRTMGSGTGRVLAQVAGRPTGLLLGLQSTIHPLKMHPTYRTIEHLPLGERVAVMRRPEVRAAILGERTEFTGAFNDAIAHAYWKMYPLGDPPDYEPHPDTAVAAVAARAGVDPATLLYDLMTADGGRGFVFFPLGDYAHGELDSTWERLQDDHVMLSLADGGAHCRLVCDASTPTFMLSHWVRDRDRGPRLPLEHVVALQTSRTAAVYGLGDRGVLAPGYRADVNVIDMESVGLGAPRMVADLPGGAARLVQGASGYRATLVAGEVTMEHGQHTGALPGRLLRGRRSADG